MGHVAQANITLHLTYLKAIFSYLRHQFHLRLQSRRYTGQLNSNQSHIYILLCCRYPASLAGICHLSRTLCWTKTIKSNIVIAIDSHLGECTSQNRLKVKKRTFGVSLGRYTTTFELCSHSDAVIKIRRTCDLGLLWCAFIKWRGSLALETLQTLNLPRVWKEI